MTERSHTILQPQPIIASSDPLKTEQRPTLIVDHVYHQKESSTTLCRVFCLGNLYKYMVYGSSAGLAAPTVRLEKRHAAACRPSLISCTIIVTQVHSTTAVPH